MSTKKVLAGGCFNSIHPGHIYFLKKAKKLGDELIVVLTNDKNNKKPYAVSAKKRKKMLEFLNIVDKVLIGNSKDKTKIVKKVKPSIIALGYDQKMPDGLENFKYVRIKKMSNYSTGSEKNRSGIHMNKKLLFLILISILTVLVLLIIVKVNFKNTFNAVCFDRHCFLAELVEDKEERERGLMFKKNLDLDKGMLFIFEEEGEYPFWMKNTLIPLDIIWINENKEVVFISENTQPCEEENYCFSVNPNKKAKYVLEINAGLAEEIGLEIGDKMNLGEKWLSADGGRLLW